jgi:ribose transport system substrate-binding protein
MFRNMKRRMPPGTGNEAERQEGVLSVARACTILQAFRSADEVLELRHVAERTGIHKVTALRLLRTLVAKGMLQLVGPRGYRSLFQPLQSKRFRIGYAAQSTVVPFIGTVTESIGIAAREARFDLIVLNNQQSRSIALKNADRFIREKVDLVIEFQLFADIADTLAEKFSAAEIPVIAVDSPQPGALYFGADNYKAGQIAGTHLGRWAAANWHGVVDEVLLLSAYDGGPVMEARLLGISDGIASALPHTGKKPEVRLDTKGHLEGSLEAVRKHLRRSRANHILVGAINDPGALGALLAFREAGCERRCAIVGQGAVSEARHEMRRPGTALVGSVAYFPEGYGEKLLRIARDMLNGRQLPRAVFTQHQIVTPANVNKAYANDLLVGRA